MAASKKITVKTLSEEFYKLKDDLKEFNAVKQKVFELEDALKTSEKAKELMKNQLQALEKKVEDLQKIKDPLNSQNEDNHREESTADGFNCRKCNDKFDSMKNLKRHLASNHPTKIDCKLCAKIFYKNHDLEVHLKTAHKTKELYNCDKCDKQFLLKWRMKKHQNNHENTTLRRCHYYNNKLTCPFEEMGCMFAHEVSDLCKFGTKCTMILCSFRHDRNPIEEPNDEESDDPDDTEENSEIEYCNFCSLAFEDVDDLIDHYGTTGHNLMED